MRRSVYPQVFDSRVHAERVERTVVVEGITVSLMRRNVKEVSALDQVQTIQGEAHLSVS